MPDSVLLGTAAPAFGLCLANAMFLSPLSAVRAARAAGDLGALNPAPYAAIVVNCLGWCGYGLVLRDSWVFFSNGPGAVIGLFFYSSAMGLAPRDVRRSLEGQLYVMVTLNLLAAYLASVAVAPADDASRMNVIGGACVLNLLVYYASPLSTLLKVLRTRSAESLHAPLAAMSTANGLMWVGYGYATDDLFILVPNLLGAALGGLQLGLLAAFKRKGLGRTSSTLELAPGAGAGGASGMDPKGAGGGAGGGDRA